MGPRIGPYRLLDKIGAGAMGEVYRASDTNLKREVAIKVLPAAVALDASRLARFRREAEALAALNHPGIAAIYGLEHTENSLALVMELVEGPTLAEHMAGRRLPQDEALTIGAAIGEALEAAHARGVIHRDLKPANIKVRPDGSVKILDFGLAKMMDPGGGASSDHESPSQSPTISVSAITEAGVVLGTPAYMSPEQARGQPADKRSDLWAFGVILFEMLAGRRPFRGDGLAETLAAVLQAEPDWSALPPLPSVLRTFLHRCLEKKPGVRIGDASVFRFVLDEARARPEVERASQGLRRFAVPAAIVVAGGLLAVAVMMRAPTARSTGGAMVRAELTPLAQVEAFDPNLAISPDGTRVVYEAADGLVTRTLDRSEPTVLFQRPARGGNFVPFFSPDGQWVGFFFGNIELMRVPATGGAPTRIARSDGGFPRGATWSESGTIVFATNTGSGLLMVSADGGEPAILTTPDAARGEADHLWPHFLPGEQAVLFTITPSSGGLDGAQLAVLNVATRAYKVVLRGGFGGRYVPTGHLLYASAGAMHSVPFDLNRRETTAASSIPVLSGVSATLSGLPNLDVSDNGTLVYLAGTNTVQAKSLVWVDRKTGVEEVLPVPPRTYLYARLSPDGTRVALDARDEASDIWIWEFARQTLTRVTVDRALDRFPVWAPDGRRVLFSSDREGVSNVYAQPADGSGPAELLWKSDSQQHPMAVSRDGRRIVIRDQLDLALLSLDGDRRLTPLLQTPASEVNAALSPDDRWLAYGSNESGTYEIYVRPFPSVSAGRWLVSNHGGSQPAWSRDGRELFFFAGTGELMAARIGDGEPWTASPPVQVVKAGYRLGNPEAAATYDVSPDGTRFLMIKVADLGTAPVQVVLDWDQELKRLVPVD